MDETITKRWRCKYCKCSNGHACPGGCMWVDGREEVCTSCEALDDLVTREFGVGLTKEVLRKLSKGYRTVHVSNR